jgi:acyl CoA:acetate/3-ketoacid CoA transferase alpha subunit
VFQTATKPIYLLNEVILQKVQQLNTLIYAANGTGTVGGEVTLQTRIRKVAGSHLGMTASF